MKSLKMFGLGTLTVLLAMALGGVPSAMAEGTELCSADESTCKSKNVVTHVHEATPEEKKAALLSSLGNVECDALFLGEVLGEVTEGPVLVQGNFTYTNCLLNGSKCEVKEASESSLFLILKEGHETASETGKGEVNVHCGLFINCTYVEENIKATGKGPLLSTLKNGEVSISEQAIKVTGTLCLKEGKLDITTTPLVETFLSQGTMYCVRYENARGRYLLGPNQTACTGNHGVRGFNYELVWARDPNLTSGNMVCVTDSDGVPGVLYYLVRNGTKCENKHKTEPEGDYELGEIA